jgi:hypothetical protein
MTLFFLPKLRWADYNVLRVELKVQDVSVDQVEFAHVVAGEA